ncbi:hypothetical protein Q8G37_17260 [Bacillus wiedmannii]|nr:hypothetical protein [Bacillus wiedmannii]MDP1458187.1 hypothetical protein [Bacillus wiedmannii]
MNQNILESFGWDSFFEEQAVENFEVGRILLEHKGSGANTGYVPKK